MSIQRSKLTPPEIARMWGVSVEKVLTWIRTGELTAINAATSRTGRPRYLVDVKALAAFEDRRQVVAQTATTPRRKPRQKQGVIEFF